MPMRRWRKTRGIALGALAIAIAGGAYVFWPAPTGSPAKLARKLGGDQVVAVIRTAVSIESFRVTDTSRRTSSQPPIRGGYIVVDGPVIPSAPLANELSTALLDPKTYKWDGSVKACIFDPGVRIDFRTAPDLVQVVICFQCDELRVERNYQPVGFLDFDPGREKLVKLAKQLFPDDQVIQALPENRKRSK